MKETKGIIPLSKNNDTLYCVPLRDRPEARQDAAKWFHEKWGIPLSAYEDSMSECLGNAESTVPQWYIVLCGKRIIAGCGVIENDFHDRKDLTPNVCAVYVEEEYRQQGIAGHMLQFVCEDMAELGVRTLYLLTDHTGFYERYGWHFYCMAQGDGEPEPARMYVYHSMEAERLILRPWMWSDADSLYKYAKDPEVGPIAGWPVHTSVENSLDTIKGVLSATETYAVVLKETGEAVGSIGLMVGKTSNIGLPEDEGEIGYWIGVPYWGQGLIPEAVRELLQYAFEELKLKKLWCGYFDGNVKSKRVQEKCGFRYHHTKEDVPCAIEGLLRTEHITCLLPDPEIRPIRESEHALLNDFLYEAIFIPEGVSKPSREIIFQPELQVYVRDFGTGSADLCYVAEINGRIVGAAWSRIMNDYGHIDDDIPSLAVAVLEEYRGQGIGTALLETLLSSLKKKGYAAVSLSVQKANPAVHLYERLGFGMVREEADEQIMRKEL